MSDNSDLITLDQAGTRSGKSKEELTKLIESGKLTGIKVNGAYQVSARDVEALGRTKTFTMSAQFKIPLAAIAAFIMFDLFLVAVVVWFFWK